MDPLSKSSLAPRSCGTSALSPRELAQHLYQVYILPQRLGPSSAYIASHILSNGTTACPTSEKLQAVKDIQQPFYDRDAWTELYHSIAIQQRELLSRIQLEALDHYGRLSMPPLSRPYDCENPSADVISSCTFEICEYLQGERALAPMEEPFVPLNNDTEQFLLTCVHTSLNVMDAAIGTTPVLPTPTYSFDYMLQRPCCIDWSTFYLSLNHAEPYAEITIADILSLPLNFVSQSLSNTSTILVDIHRLLFQCIKHANSMLTRSFSFDGSTPPPCFKVSTAATLSANEFWSLQVLTNRPQAYFLLAPSNLQFSQFSTNIYFYYLSLFFDSYIGLAQFLFEKVSDFINLHALHSISFFQPSAIEYEDQDTPMFMHVLHLPLLENFSQIFTSYNVLLFLLNETSIQSQILQTNVAIGLTTIDSSVLSTLEVMTSEESLLLTLTLCKKLSTNLKHYGGFSQRLLHINAKEHYSHNISALPYLSWVRFCHDTLSWYEDYGPHNITPHTCLYPLLTETPPSLISNTGKEFYYDPQLSSYCTKEILSNSTFLQRSISLKPLRVATIRHHDTSLKSSRVKRRAVPDIQKRSRNHDQASDLKDIGTVHSAAWALTDALHQGNTLNLNPGTTDSGIIAVNSLNQLTIGNTTEFRTLYNHTDEYIDNVVTLFDYTNYSLEERLQRNKALLPPHVITATTIQSRLISYATKHMMKRLRSNKQAFAPGAELARIRRIVKDQISTYKRLLREGRDAYNRDSKIRIKLESKRAEQLQEKHQRERLDFLIRQTEQYTFDNIKSKTGVTLVNTGADKANLDSTDLFKLKILREDLENEYTDEEEALSKTKDNPRTLNISGLNIDLKKQPAKFIGKLKKYQIIGFSWLVNRFELELNSILSDEMGLGKSVQTIAFFQHLVEKYHYHGPFLIIAPNSLLINWIKELKKFVPSLLLWPYWGTQRERMLIKRGWATTLSFGHNIDAAMEKNENVLGKSDSILHVVITSYQIAVSDIKTLAAIPWKTIVLDEAQLIKSSGTQRWRTIMKYKSRCKVLLSGTPIQNSLEELWALLHFVMPELFERKDDFAEWFSKDIESAASRLGAVKLNADQLRRLQGILAPFVLRRVKGDVEKDLGSKKEIIIKCSMSYHQARLYKTVQQQFSLDTMRSSKDDADIRNIVMQLRKICCHPDLFEHTSSVGPFMLYFFVSQSRWYQGTKYLDVMKTDIEGDPDDDDDRLSTVTSATALAISGPKQQRSSRRACTPSQTSGLTGAPSMSSIYNGPAAQDATLPTTSSMPLISGLSDPPGMLQPDGDQIFTVDSQSSLVVAGVDDSLGSSKLFNARKDLMFKRNAQSDVEAFTDIFVKIGMPDVARANYIGRRINPSNACSDIELALPSPVLIGFCSNLAQKITECTIAKYFNIWNTDVPILRTISRFLALSIQDLGFLAYCPLLIAYNAAWPALFPMIAHFPFDTKYETRFSIILYLYSLIGSQLISLDRSVLSDNFLSTLPSILVNPSSLLVVSPISHLLASDVMEGSQLNALIDNSAIKKTGCGFIETLSKASHIRYTQKDLLALQQFKQCWLVRASNDFLENQHLNHLLVYDAIVPKVFGLQPQVHIPTTFKLIHTHDIQALLRGEELYRESTFIGSLVKPQSHFSLELYDHRHISNSLLNCPVYSKSVLRLIKDSGKLTALDKLLHTLYKTREPVLIYCQMTKMLDLLEDYLVFRRYNYVRLDGGDAVNKRGQIVERFMTDDTIFVFLLSTRAASLGLNLTRASTVIFYENDWNPTQDAQAMDRVHRLGQKKSVVIYRLVTEGSIDEKILEKARSKEIVQELVLRGQRRDEFGNLVHVDAYDNQPSKTSMRRMTRDDYLDLLLPSRGDK
ncbi:Transcriptional activator, putative [Giardia lamblia P15]|uniref:Chromatin-remodeling ATPase INO80 n=1 Tax=Giardia intestinalis (strain P15) TaxID=658858 RepID=E1F2V8_GIAIA|nr:Transcriptional activator, putative [Giardia lamblia P15]